MIHTRLGATNLLGLMSLGPNGTIGHANADILNRRGSNVLGSNLLSEFYARSEPVARRQMLRVGRKFSVARGYPIPKGFFDDYPRFYTTSQTTAIPNRLNQRHKACIEWNAEAIRGKRILDLASHDGRWSFAAIKAGAVNVVGIEARNYLVQSATANLRDYGVPDNSFSFISGDAFEQLDRVEPHSVDTVFCLGFFYHITNHMLLLSKIARLKPKYLILDTAIHFDPNNVILLYTEDPEGEANAASIEPDAPERALCGAPSKGALQLMLSNFGWSFAYYDWHRAGIRRWDSIEDYHEGWRVTLRVTCAV